ncbi:MAG: magnesium transporter [Bacteroidota bacterium]|jgi:magnesium transporter|nr:magnesium transporter [Bacteroidota bacterium]
MTEFEKHNTEEDELFFDSVDGVRSTTVIADAELLEDIEELVRADARPALLNILLDLHSADIASIINELPREEGRYLFEMLPPEEASEVLLDLHENVREDFLEELTAKRLSEIVEELDSDDAVDIVAELDEDIAEQVLEKLEPEDSAELRALLSYDEETAGGLMATEFPTVLLSGTVEDAIDAVRQTAEETPDIYEVYVVDEDGSMRGVVDLKNLLLVKPRTPVSEIYDSDVISVRTDVDQEDVANVMRKYDLLTLPVVDTNNHPVGIITFDDIADVIHEEAQEDIQRMSGIMEDTDTSSSIFEIFRGRLPWLLVGFAGELLAAMVLSSFEAQISKVIAAAFFIPIIMAMGGNAGIQASSIVVRGLATGELALSKTFRRLGREFFAALLNGSILSSLLFVVVYLWIGDASFGITVALSLLVVITNATLVGATVPLILDRMNIDPALATGPFITTSNDALGLFIYLGFLTIIYL